MQQEQQNNQQLLGDQGNEGMYGQGQYDSEGKPQGPEAQRIKPDPKVNEQSSSQKSQDASQNNPNNQSPSQSTPQKQ